MSKNPDQGWKIEQIEKGIHDRRNHTRRAVPLERRDVALLEGPPRCASGPASTPCGIGGNPDVQAFVRHIWSVELRWAQRLADLPETPKEAVPTGPLNSLFDLHLQAAEINKSLLADPAADWEAPYTLTAPSIPPEKRTVSRRKVMGHALFHSQRHWAQLATLVRAAGFPSGFSGDLLSSSALR
jgi:uncharacterized damage-inducible protein DinB